jgi:hypothetical protein
MAVDNGDASFSGFSRRFINSMTVFPRFVDNPMDNHRILLKKHR